MITTDVTFSMFWDWLQSSDSYKDNFSYDGAKALFDYLETMSDETGEDIDYDPIAWCVEFSEYASALEASQEYDYDEVVDLEPHGSVDLVEVAALEEAQALEWLQDRTSVIEFDGGVVITDF